MPIDEFKQHFNILMELMIYKRNQGLNPHELMKRSGKKHFIKGISSIGNNKPLMTIVFVQEEKKCRKPSPYVQQRTPTAKAK